MSRHEDDGKTRKKSGARSVRKGRKRDGTEGVDEEEELGGGLAVVGNIKARETFFLPETRWYGPASVEQACRGVDGVGVL